MWVLNIQFANQKYLTPLYFPIRPGFSKNLLWTFNAWKENYLNIIYINKYNWWCSSSTKLVKIKLTDHPYPRVISRQGYPELSKYIRQFSTKMAAFWWFKTVWLFYSYYLHIQLGRVTVDLLTSLSNDITLQFYFKN